MDKIELHQIVQYLPYGLVCIRTALFEGGYKCYKYNLVVTPSNVECGIRDVDGINIKPILRQFTPNDVYDYFSDKLEMDISPYTFISEEFLHEFSIAFDEIFESKTEWLPVGLYNLLIKHHFDIFGLIEKGLAVDINSLNQK